MEQRRLLNMLKNKVKKNTGKLNKEPIIDYIELRNLRRGYTNFNDTRVAVSFTYTSKSKQVVKMNVLVGVDVAKSANLTDGSRIRVFMSKKDKYEIRVEKTNDSMTGYKLSPIFGRGKQIRAYRLLFSWYDMMPSKEEMTPRTVDHKIHKDGINFNWKID